MRSIATIRAELANTQSQIEDVRTRPVRRRALRARRDRLLGELASAQDARDGR